ncbi:MAG: sodium:solute symporter family transporter, partial [Planctomycetota bacterium]
MQLGALDIGVFVAFFGVVVGVSMYKSRREKTGEDYFLASRSLLWPFIGLSLIAANISTEHFVGMAGQGAGIAGMAIASYEWLAAITLVCVAIFFLPRFLRSGIFTIPEYL